MERVLVYVADAYAEGEIPASQPERAY